MTSAQVNPNTGDIVMYSSWNGHYAIRSYIMEGDIMVYTANFPAENRTVRRLHRRV